jgi:XTP/dITP diphosphohydrolase
MGVVDTFADAAPAPPFAVKPLEVLILGTHNRKKAVELADLLSPRGLEVRSLADVPRAIEVAEDGDTFAANAAKKAAEQAAHLDAWVLAEDSGLAVDALGGAPGVYSARFAGPGSTDDANNRLLLEKLAGIPPERRGAHYVCHLALADPAGNIRAASSGECRGRILTQPAGSGGFGYDPLFEIPEFHQTFAQLGPVVKSVLSHRSRAMRAILPQVLALAGK